MTGKEATRIMKKVRKEFNANRKAQTEAQNRLDMKRWAALARGEKVGYRLTA